MSTDLRPPFAYFGGKTTVAGRIVALLPEHEHYIEPFAGSLSVLLTKPRSKMETVNDIDQDLMTFWRVLRDQPEELVRVSALTPHSRAEFEASYDLDDVGDIERARRVWVRLSQGRSGTLRRTGWRHYKDAAGSSIGMPHYLAAYADRMLDVADRIRHVTLECRDALDVIVGYGRHETTLLYVDPPYVASARRGKGYAHEMRDDDDHRALAAALHGAVASVVLSGYDSDLYDDLYSDWCRVEFPAFTGNAVGDGWRTEVLWFNRPLAARDLTLFEVAAS